MKFLMCPPRHFGVEYVINPWMEGQIGRAQPEVAHKEWAALHAGSVRHEEVGYDERAQEEGEIPA